MASELRVNTLKDAAGNNSIATSFVAGGSAKAWINFAGAGTSINDSLNISSLADNATGKFTVTMSSAMDAVNYTVVTGIQESGTGNTHMTSVRSDVTITTTVFGIATYSGASYQDVTLVYDTVQGDLA
jgi:hypothetical protein